MISPMSGEQERLAAGQENLLHAELRGFAGDPAHAFKAQRPARRPWRGSHAAIAALQIAVEIRVQPEARADGPGRLRLRRRLAASDHISVSVSASTVDSIRLLRVNRHQASKSALRSGLAGYDRHEIARAAAPERGDQLGQQAVGERLLADVDLEVRFHRHWSYLPSLKCLREYELPPKPQVRMGVYSRLRPERLARTGRT